MGWRKIAEEVRQGEEVRDNRDIRDNSRTVAADTPAVPIRASDMIRQWQAGLATLDPANPLQGIDRGRWPQLLDDADWLLENYAAQAARDGWSALDLFGVLPGRDGWGGIACRLRGSRSLVMSADVARWRRVVNGEPESFARGLGDTVQMVPLWQSLAEVALALAEMSALIAM